jgi:hypothetical protein
LERYGEWEEVQYPYIDPYGDIQECGFKGEQGNKEGKKSGTISREEGSDL